MITATEAARLKNSFRKPIWHNEDFADAVVRLDREIRDAAEGGADGTSLCFNPAHMPTLLTILRERGFVLAKVNAQDNFRLDLQW